MKTLDNWASVKQYLDFSDPDRFYFVELLQRRKDNPELPVDTRMVKYYWVTSAEYYDAIEEEAKRLSDMTGARIYIYPNRRSYKKCCLNLIKEATQLVIDEEYRDCLSLDTVVIGRYPDEPEKKWIIDLDGDDVEKEAEIIDFIDSIEPYETGTKVKWINPTVNGMHLMTSAFNIQKFKQKFPGIAIHKDNLTLLYFRHE